MDKEQLIQRLMSTFVAELDEHVRALNRDLLALEKDPGADRTELIKTLFRTVHSLKGAARSVNITLIEATCHRLESIFGSVREGVLAVRPELIELLFLSADALKDAGERLRAKQDLTAGTLPALLPRLEAASRGARPEQTARTPGLPTSPASPPTPAATDGFVRVPAVKLDALLARSGELLVARRRAGARQEDVGVLLEALEQTQAEWRRVQKPLRKLLGADASASDAGTARNDPRSGAAPRPLPRRAALAIDRTEANLKKLARGFEILSSRMEADQHALEQVAVPLEDEVRRVRMLPFGDACEGFERVVRDLSRASGKEVDLVVEGSDVELDRSILEGLKDPLLHLVRNAVDHGLESPEERRTKGKPPRGRITVAAALRGTGVEVVVADDGPGLDLGRIREHASRRNLTVPKEERELARLVFLPGFSTARLITQVSGRGVGLDVVKHRVEALHGTVDLSFEPGHGTRFVLALPLTLTTVRSLLIECRGQVFALPAVNVRRLVRVGPSDLGSVEGREVLLGGSAPLPVVGLADVLGIPAGEPRRPGAKVALVVVEAGGQQVALAVDELLAEHEIVVKSLGPRLRKVQNFAGATVLPAGDIALILNVVDLVGSALGRSPGRTLAAALEDRAPAKKRRLLVVDDSVTTRSLEKSILEAAGFEVLTAADGAEAWLVLQEKGADLVVSDVEMPRLDGFGLTEVIRGSKRFRELPAVLVTALETEKDKARGLEVGADAYLPKSTFDQTALLEAIKQLVRTP